MDNIRLVPARISHINRIANNMRAIDALECTAMGRTPKEALRSSLLNSDKAWTALVDDVPQAMFGVVINSVLSRDATPWFLGTDEVYRHARAMIQWGPGIIERLSDSKFRLSNVVSSRNDRAIRLLKKWGFTVYPEEHEFGGEMFRAFEKEPVLCAALQH